MKRTVVLLAVVLAAAMAPSALGTALTFTTVTVGPADIASGPSFAVLGGVLAGDTITMETTGIMYLQSGGTYGTNAAGIVVVPGSSGVGQSLMNGSTTFGALLLGNPVGGLFYQVYPSDASNGLGSSSPPTDLVTTLNLSSFAGGSLIGATALQFRLSDTITSDNSGQYTVSSSIPEPASAALIGFGLLAAALLARRRKA